MQVFHNIWQYIFFDHPDVVVTVIVGFLAYVIYRFGKNDQLIDAATLILEEVREAEKKVDEIDATLRTKKDTGSFTSIDYPSILPTNSWNRYSYLFVRKLNRDQLQSLSRFYEMVESIKFLVEKDNSFFWSNSAERSRVVHDELAKLYYEHFDPAQDKIDDEIYKTFAAKTSAYVQAPLSDYRPGKTALNLETQLKLVPKLVNTSVWDALRKLAHQKRNS